MSHRTHNRPMQRRVHRQSTIRWY